MPRLSHFALVVLLPFAIGACDDTPAPEPGEVRVTLVSPNGVEGAAVFEVQGLIDGVDAVSGNQAFEVEGSGGSHVVVVRESAGSVSFRMRVENVHQPPTVRLLQVAGPDDRLRATLDGYRVEVGR